MVAFFNTLEIVLSYLSNFKNSLIFGSANRYNHIVFGSVYLSQRYLGCCRGCSRISRSCTRERHHHLAKASPSSSESVTSSSQQSSIWCGAVGWFVVQSMDGLRFNLLYTIEGLIGAITASDVIRYPPSRIATV